VRCLLDPDQGGNGGVERNCGLPRAGESGGCDQKEYAESQWSRPSSLSGMELPTFLYRCPNAGLRVQGWIGNDPTERDEESFEAATCPACGRVHLVNPQPARFWAQTTTP